MPNIKNIKLITLAAAISAGLALPVCAEDKSGVNAAEMAGGDGGAVAQLSMAQDLYRYGVANSDALAVLAAARITGAVDAEDVEREVETMPTEGVEITEEGEGTDSPATAEMMYEKALELAGGDPAITGLIGDAMAEGARGRIGGASRTLSRLRAGHTDIFREGFYGGRLAEIAILGDGDADLDLLVADENGNTICLDRSYSDRLYCSFTPAWTGNFTIIVKNMGRIRNSYYILTN
ncbi:hypothetical protein LCL97_23355 [Seohaeicola saemankumensis]|nr:hypothetical protein [Seohaeicola saemankumensis]MCA0873780.1 hypothetical protein [Seohaeicola saemankumensis]